MRLVYDGDLILDPLVQSIRWSGDVTTAVRTLEVSLKATIDGRSRVFTVEAGKELRLNDGSDELFRGVIFSHKIDADGNMSLTAYDENIYLTKNYDDSVFKNMTASGIIRQLCADFGIPVGDIDNTGFVIPRLICRDNSLWEMMTMALTITRNQTGRRFFIFSQGGRLHLKERKARVLEWVLENGTNIIGASYSQSIEDLRNQVKVIGGDREQNPLIATIKDQALIDMFGTMQHLAYADADATQSEVDQLARELLDQLGKIADEATIEVIGLNECIAGVSVYVYESMTGIIGSYYVTSDEHTFEGGVHRMYIRLSATDDLPTMEYREPPSIAQTEKAKTAKGGGSIEERVFAANAINR